MIQYERIDAIEEIDFDKTSSSRECIICHYWYFDTGFKYQPYVCNGCHDFSMTVQNVSDVFLVTVKNVDYRCYIVGIDKKDAISLLGEKKDAIRSIIMDFGTNETPIEVINKGSFGGTYSRNIYSRVNDNFYKNSWREFKELKNIDKKYYSSNYYNASLNIYGVKCGT